MPPAAASTATCVVRFDVPQPTTSLNRRSNPRNATKQRYIVNSTGATPKKGKSMPRTGPFSREQLEFNKRCDRCDGSNFGKIVVPKGERDKYKKKCYLCGTDTTYICVICKRPVYEVNRDEKLRKLISSKDPKVAFLNGERPPSALRFESRSYDGTGSTFYTVENSCHRILHQNSKSSL